MKTTELEVLLSEIRPNGWNPKDGDATKSERVNKSLGVHGQLEPLLVREVGKGFELINGHHRLLEMKALGWDKVTVRSVGKITDDEAKSLALATEDANVPIDRLLASKLVDELLEASVENLKVLPYSEQDAKAMQSLAKFDWHDTVLESEPVEKEQSKEARRMVTIPDKLFVEWMSQLQSHGGSDTEFLVHLLETYAEKETK